MNKIYFTPGPTELHKNVRIHIQTALDNKVCSINHRSNEFMNIYNETSESLKSLINIPGNYNIFFISSATECMDRIIQNCVDKYSFHFVNGAFSERFFRTSVELNKNAAKAEKDYGKGFDFENLNIKNTPELICFTQNETSTGVAVKPEDIYNFKNKFPEALIAVDIVSSAPYVNLDFSKIDCAFFSVQKGFGLPAGLGVLIVNDRCMAKANLIKSNGNAGSYHNFASLYENALKSQTSETPNVLGIYLLGKVCIDLLDYGIEKIREETDEKAKILYEHFEKHKYLKPFVKSKEDRSQTVIAIDTGVNQKTVKQKLSGENIIVGSGYGKFKDVQIRIANFPMHNKNSVQRITEILKD